MKYKWTPSSVAKVDWSKKSDAETIKACIEHWEERIKAGIVDGHTHWWSSLYCPACAKFASCCNCVLGSLCCEDRWREAAEELFDGRIGKACHALLKYLKKKYKELEKKGK